MLPVLARVKRDKQGNITIATFQIRQLLITIGSNLTGAIRLAKRGDIDESVAYNHYASFSVQATRVTSFLVTKSEETTRSHPEHGRKDSHRRKYLAGHRLGR